MGPELFPASRKRVLLAIYLDYVLFSALLTLILYLSTGQVELPTWQELAAFTLLEGLLYSVSGSPGQYVLSMKTAKIAISTPGTSPETKDGLFVDPEIARHESWLTMTIGVLLILEGSKQLVRWTMWTPPLPFFGIPLDPASFATVSVIMGTITMFVGYAFLKLMRVAFWLGGMMAIAFVASVIPSWSQWDQIAQEIVVRRRTFQGLPVRVGEVEFMQALLPEMLVVGSLLSLVFILLAKKRLRY